MPTLPPPQWLALSDHVGPLGVAAMPDLLQSGTLVLEMAQPKPGALVLMDYRGAAPQQCTLSIFYDADSGISLLHRQGDSVLRYHLPGPLPQAGPQTRICYAWNVPACTWSLRLEDPASGALHQVTGSNPMPISGADMLALCAGPNAARRDSAVLWFGLCTDSPIIPPSAWLGQRTPVQTPTGPVAAGRLRAGDLVQTLDHGAQPILATRAISLPNRGDMGPVLLRAPYFADHIDVLVAPGQLILLSGVGVEYLFGEDTVLASAAALRDGNSALSDTRRPMTNCIALDLGKPALILADGCPLLCSPDAATALPYRLLHAYEVLPLQALSGRGGQRNAA